MSHSNALSTRATGDQVVALIHARAILQNDLEEAMEFGREDQYGSLRAGTLRQYIEDLNGAFPEPFATMEDPLVALTEGC